MRQRAVAATLWSGAEVLFRQGLLFVVAIVLARQLDPAEVGVVATLALFLSVGSVLIDGGLSIALLQRQDIDHVDESTVFWFNLVVGATVALALAAMAPFLSAFFELPLLLEITPVMASTVFFSSLGSIHAALINKRLEFRRLLVVNVAAAVLAGATAVLLALHGAGAWALVGQALVTSIATSALLWMVDSWRPSWVFSRTSLRKLSEFGGFHLASTFLEAIYSRLYTVLIGRWFGARELGYYANADATQKMPARLLSGVLLRAAFPLFAEAAQQPERLRRGLQVAVRGSMVANAPIMLGAAAVAEPLVRVIFGERWLPAAPVLAVLCLAGSLFPVQSLNVHVLMAQGRSRQMFKIEVLKKTVGVALMLFGSLFGLLGIAWSQVVAALFALVVNTRYSERLLSYGLRAQARDFLPPWLAAALMAVAVAALQRAWPWTGTSSAGLLVLVGFGALIFVALALASRMRALSDVLLLVRRSSSADSKSDESSI